MKKFLLLIFLLIFFLLPQNVLASHPCGTSVVRTAIGPICTQPADFAQDVLGILMGIAGGIAFLFLVAGGFKLATSKGDPDALQSGKETITAAIGGLLFILFAVLILRVIGINILGIPGFV